MNPNFDSFVHHDIAHFPVVLAPAAAAAGYAAQWAREMEALLDHGKAFVLVHLGTRGEESHDDRKQRGLWLKRRKAELGAVCRAVISVEPDTDRRAELATQSLLAQKAFGIPMLVAASEAEAHAQAQRLLAPEGGG